MSRRRTQGQFRLTPEMPEPLTEDWEKRTLGAAQARVGVELSQPSWRQASRALAPLTEKQHAFIEWLVDPSPDKGSQGAWCRENGVPDRTAREWKKSAKFKTAWETRLSELNVEPDRLQEVINAIYRQATSGDVKAASLYLQYVDRFTPKKHQIVEDRSVSDLSDAELAAELRDHLSVLDGGRSA